MNKYLKIVSVLVAAAVLSGCAPLEPEAVKPQLPRFQTEMSYFEEELGLPTQTDVDTRACYRNPEKIRYTITTFYMETDDPDGDYARLVKLADDRGYDLYSKTIFGSNSNSADDGHQIDISPSRRDDQGNLYLTTEYSSPCYYPDDLPEYNPKAHNMKDKEEQ